jgi:hypothetical protein
MRWASDPDGRMAESLTYHFEGTPRKSFGAYDYLPPVEWRRRQAEIRT